MNKICTSLGQSKKLIELGINVNTADMHYSTWTILNEGEYILSPNQGETIEELQKDYGNQIIPAWSLSALLNFIRPYEYSLSTSLNNKIMITINSPHNLSLCFYDDPIDAAVEMIIRLKENGKI